MMTPDERYLRDMDFKVLVDMLHGMIRRCQYTPTELREAVLLAAIRYEMYDAQPRVVVRDGKVAPD